MTILDGKDILVLQKKEYSCIINFIVKKQKGNNLVMVCRAPIRHAISNTLTKPGLIDFPVISDDEFLTFNSACRFVKLCEGVYCKKIDN